ncbi:uncharacterized protein LOC105211334 [Zeugodacus cucurbitae]|uniref:uncharacterized protein LOC105211334 n=1 Tax=Zeugodacus cucurbitae TaxID=28588 RepID=UPI0023D8F776|nr:uncharacterized protein LOC105211334 [Zeugodacus cucurbitae]
MRPTMLPIWQFLFIFVAAFQQSTVECKSFFGIGTRIHNDQLLLKDVLQARSVGVGEGQEVGFNYAIPEPITYIEIVSEQNVLADVNFSYQNNLVKGSITALDNENGTETSDDVEPFEVQISIYGFNETMLNISPSYILNRDQQFQGILGPYTNEDFDYEIDEDDFEEAVDRRNTSEEAMDELEEEMNYTDDFGDPDKIIELGMRQADDYLLYETYQTSQTSTQEPSNHSVTFYYIDSNFITYVRFIIFDHTVNKASHDYTPPVATYTHFSPSSLKAIITDDNTTNLFVQMFIYGYQLDDLPVDYKPFLTSMLDATTESPLERLKMLLNAKLKKNLDDSAEINFETGERNAWSDNSTNTTDVSTRNQVNDFAVFNVVFVCFLLNFNFFV